MGDGDDVVRVPVGVPLTPEIVEQCHGALLAQSAKPDQGSILPSDAFLGIDRSAEPSMAGTFIDAAAHPITPETINEAVRLMEEHSKKMWAPCGSEQFPHIVGPVAMREATHCGNCGQQVVRVSDTRCVEVADQQWYRLPAPTLAPDPPRLPYVFLVPTSPLTAEEAAEARELMKRGHSEESAVAEVRAKKSLMIKVDSERGSDG